VTESILVATNAMTGIYYPETDAVQSAKLREDSLVEEETQREQINAQKSVAIKWTFINILVILGIQDAPIPAQSNLVTFALMACPIDRILAGQFAETA
jgi:hypothetical protein